MGEAKPDHPTSLASGRECGHNGHIRWKVSIRELKDHLSEYLRRVQKGARLVVTDRKRPIAEIGPVSHARLSPEQWFTLLAEEGELTRPARRGKFRDVKATKIRGKRLSATILDDRR